MSHNFQIFRPRLVTAVKPTKRTGPAMMDEKTLGCPSGNDDVRQNGVENKVGSGFVRDLISMGVLPGRCFRPISLKCFARPHGGRCCTCRLSMRRLCSAGQLSAFWSEEQPRAGRSLAAVAQRVRSRRKQSCTGTFRQEDVCPLDDMIGRCETSWPLGRQRSTAAPIGAARIGRCIEELSTL